MTENLDVYGELAERLFETIAAYDGRVYTVGVIGVLEVLKSKILELAEGN